MDEPRLRHILRKKAEQEIPETMDLRNRILQAAAPNRPLYQRRFGWQRVALVAVLMLLTATAAYAFYQTRVQPDAGIGAVQADNLIVQLDQSEAITISGDIIQQMTVTLDYAYADSNRITVAYEIDGIAVPDAQVVLFANPTLSDSQGRAYFWLPASGQQLQAGTPSETDTAFGMSGIMSFDSSGVQEQPEALDLTLQLDVAYTTAELQQNDPFAMMMAGRASFSFSLPFNQGQQIAVEQSAAASNLEIRVNQVVIAPSLTRVDLCYDPTGLAGDQWLSWQVDVSLSIAGHPLLDHQPADLSGSGGEPLSPDAPCRALVISQSLSGQSGTWELTLHGFRNVETGETLEGEWRYQFEVPAS